MMGVCPSPNGAHVNNALLILFVVTGLILILFWREVIAAYRSAQRKGVGKEKRGYVRQLSDHEKGEVVQATTQQGVEARFEADRMKRKGSLIHDMANRSEWKDGAPSSELAKSMASEIEEVEIGHVGKRTVPSREIEEVDRSDRPGEDLLLTDRVIANAAVQGAPKELQDVLADEHVAMRKAERDELSDAVESLDAILDD
tara:strand:- start:907 stop:1506 length:600 start_codon:yes stop_codon:yes gene_type:complete